ncbi:MAG: carbon-nitrogen hydrolase family protein [Thermoanaerobaculia bacterium]
MTAHRIRVAALQYYIRPVASFDQFRDQVTALVETAADYQAQLVVFPEYFTVQLLTLGDTRGAVSSQVRVLARQLGIFRELMADLSRRFGLYLVAGSIPAIDAEDESRVYNQSMLFSPEGALGVQRKLHMTRWENEEWLMTPGNRLRVFETALGRIAITICYDVEFPELAREAARAGALILVVPSCTDDRQGYLRVRYCAHARAIENTMYVIQSSTVGSLPMVPAVSLNYGQAAILTPSDFPFSRDGILAEGIPNQETMVIGELNLDTLREARETGTVLPLRDSQRSAVVADALEILRL